MVTEYIHPGAPAITTSTEGPLPFVVVSLQKTRDAERSPPVQVGRDAIYESLWDRFRPFVRGMGIVDGSEQWTDLDGLLWDLAGEMTENSSS